MKNINDLPDRIYYQVNGKSAEENLIEQKQKIIKNCKERQRKKLEQEQEKKKNEKLIEKAIDKEVHKQLDKLFSKI